MFVIFSSVYEVYVKEETVGADTRNDIPIGSNEPGPSGLVMQVSNILAIL